MKELNKNRGKKGNGTEREGKRRATKAKHKRWEHATGEKKTIRNIKCF